MQANVKIVVMLSNPEGVWEDEVKVECENTKTLGTSHRQIVAMFQRDGGLWRTLSDTEHEFIPMLRIRSVSVSVEQNRISEDTNVAGAIQEATVLSGKPGIHVVR